MSIKKTLSFILIFSIILSSFATAIYAIEDAKTEEEIEIAEETSIEDAPYYREVTVLSALGIMEGKSETDFGADDFLTRAEMSTIAVRFLGLETENQGGAESNYSDVDSTHWGKYYIDTATALDVVSGNGDGTFSPDEETTAEQALKMLVCSLGYEPKAEELGGYPKGYLTTANQLGLLKGVDFSAGYDKPVERWKIAMMVYNALEVDLMEIKAYGDDKESAISKDTTALKKYHKTERGNGYIKGTYSSTLDNEYLDKGEVKIDDTKYVTDLNMGEFVGYNVDFYSKKENDSKRAEIIAFFPQTDISKATEIDFDSISAVDVTPSLSVEAEYYEEKGSRVKRETVSNPVIVYNGKAESFKTAEEIQIFLDENMNQGTLVFLDNSSDFRDVLFVKNYDAYVVSSADAESQRINYNTYEVGKTTTQTLDLSDDENPQRRVFIFDENGEEISIGDLVANDVIMVYVSLDKNIYTIYQSKKQVTGTIEKRMEVPGTAPVPTEPVPTPEPTPEPQPYWETLSEIDMDGFTMGNHDNWTIPATKEVDGRTVQAMASGEGKLIHRASSIYNIDELDNECGDPSQNKPDIVDDKVFLLSRAVNNTTGDSWFYKWPTPGSGFRVKNIFDKSKVKEGDKVKITAWIYTSYIFEGYGGLNGKNPGPVQSKDQTLPTNVRMWLSQPKEELTGNVEHQSPAPNPEKRPNEHIYTEVPTQEWTEVSFTYTVDNYTKDVTSIRLDSYLPDAEFVAPYPLRFILGGVKAEKYVDPMAGKEEEIVIIPRPEIEVDPTDYHIYIDGEKYLPVSNFPTSLLEMGKNVTLLLDNNNKIVGYIQSLAMTGYGMLMDVGVGGSPFGENLSVKILEADNTLKVYETTEIVEAYNGEKVVKMKATDLVTDKPADPKDDWHLWSTNNSSNFEAIPRTWLTDEAKSKAASRKIVYYETNSKGQIHTIIVPSIPEEHPDCKIVMVKDFEYDENDTTNKSILFHSWWPKFLTHANVNGRFESTYRLADDGKILKYMVWSEDYSEDDYMAHTGGMWQDNVLYGRKWEQAQLYRLPGSKTIDFIVTNPKAVSRAKNDSKTIIVDNVEETEDGYILNGFYPIEMVTSNNSYSLKLKKDLRLFENLWMTQPNSEGEQLTWENIPYHVGTIPYQCSYEALGQDTPYVTPETLEAGDVVSVVEYGGEIVYLEVIRRVSTSLFSSYATISKHNRSGFLYKDGAFANGEITEINYKEGYVKVKGFYWPSANELVSSSSALYKQNEDTAANRIIEMEIIFPLYRNTTIWDEKTKQYQAGVFGDINIGDLILIVGRIDAPQNAIIFKNHNK